MNSLYFALQSGIKHRHLRSSPCQIAVRERPYLYYMEDISKITQWGCMDKKNQAEGGHSSYKSRPSRALLYEFVQMLLCLNASKSPSRCFLPSAFTPSNINLLAPLNHWKTIRKAEPSAKYTRKQALVATKPTTLCSHQVVPVWSRWAVDNGENWTP